MDGKNNKAAQERYRAKPDYPEKQRNAFHYLCKHSGDTEKYLTERQYKKND